MTAAALPFTWGGETHRGWLAVPHTFIRNFGKLGLPDSAFLLVQGILSHAWDDHKLPFPTIDLLIEYTEWSRSKVFRVLDAVKDHGLVKVISGTRGKANEYDFRPLFARLAGFDPAPTRQGRKDDTLDANQGRSGDTHQGRTDDTPSTSTTRTSTSSSPSEKGPSPEQALSLRQRLAAARRAAEEGAAKTEAAREEKAQRRRSAPSEPATPRRTAPPTRSQHDNRSAGRRRYESRSPSQYKSPDLWFVLHDAWVQKWQSSKPALFNGKDRGLAKKLLDSYGGETCKRVIEEAIARWEEVQSRFRIQGHPSVGIFYGFRNSIFPFILEPATDPRPKQAGSQYNPSEANRAASSGWGDLLDDDT